MKLRLRFTKTGLRYCIRHHGIVDVDEEVCDFRDDELDETACDLRQLGYRTRRP